MAAAAVVVAAAAAAGFIHPLWPPCFWLADEEAPFSMHLGAYGQAYFAAETMEIVSGTTVAQLHNRSNASRSMNNSCTTAIAAGPGWLRL
jgi:hypothetical protein